MNENSVSTEEILDECAIIYDYNYQALVLHVYTLVLASNKKIAKSKIMQDFEEKRNIDKYRTHLLRVMDSFKEEIEEYKQMTNFDIRGVHSSLLYCYDNKNRVNKLPKMVVARLEKELVKVIYYAERILQEVSNVKQ